MTEPMKVYVAQWGLRTGILVCSAKLDASGRKVPIDDWVSHSADEWYDTLEEALAECERLRAKAIVAAEKRLAKLRTMPIKVLEE